MKTVSIHDAKTNLSKYIAAAKRGEKIYIGGFGKPEVVLTLIPDADQTKSRRMSWAAATKKLDLTGGPTDLSRKIDDYLYGDE